MALILVNILFPEKCFSSLTVAGLVETGGDFNPEDGISNAVTLQILQRGKNTGLAIAKSIAITLFNNGEFRHNNNNYNENQWLRNIASEHGTKEDYRFDGVTYYNTSDVGIIRNIVLETITNPNGYIYKIHSGNSTIVLWRYWERKEINDIMRKELNFLGTNGEKYSVVTVNVNNIKKDPNETWSDGKIVTSYPRGSAPRE
jgi:hypothetical protein